MSSRKSFKVRVGSGSVVTVSEKDYVAAGGEAAIYRSADGQSGYRIYHDPTKAMPLGKLQELQKLTHPNVIRPLEILYDPVSGSVLGEMMKFLNDTYPLCKLFTRSFKLSNGVSETMIMELVKAMQLECEQVHQDRCLIVDFNEMNVLVGADLVTPYIIDTGSFQTPSFPATAIMASVRDPKASVGSGYKPTEMSDWFSWAILAFQLYVNIHPFKGSHPNYAPAQWDKRMEDCASVFDTGVRLPTVCNPLSVIPPRHLNYFKAVFQKGERSKPPLPDGIAPQQVPNEMVIIQGSQKFAVSQVTSYDSDLLFRINYCGSEWAVTKTSIYFGSTPHKRTEKFSRLMLCPAADGTPIAIGSSKGDTSVMATLAKDPTVPVFKTRSKSGKFFIRNNALYTMWSGKLLETTFRSLGGKIIGVEKPVENVAENSAVMYNGVILQVLLGRTWLAIPYQIGKSSSIPVPELDGYRIIGARCERNVCVVLSETSGKYYRHAIIFSDTLFREYTIRETPDVSYDEINMTVKDNGVCILLRDANSIEVFKDNTQMVQVSDPPFDSSMRLFSHSGQVFFANRNAVFTVSLR